MSQLSIQTNSAILSGRSKNGKYALVRASSDIHHQSILNSVGLLRVEFDTNNSDNIPSYGTAVILKTGSIYPYILTAAHNVVRCNSDKQSFDKPKKIWFELRVNNQSWKFWDLSRIKTKFTINPHNIHVHTKYLKSSTSSSQCAYDIALIKCSHISSKNKHSKPHKANRIKTVEKLRHIYKTIQQFRENKKMGCELLIPNEKHKRISIVGFPAEHKGQMYASNGKLNKTQTQQTFTYNISTPSGQDGSPIFLQQIFTKMDKTNPFKNLVSVIGIHFQQNKGVKITQEKYDWIRRMLKKLCVQDDISAKITFNEYPKKSGRYSLSFNNMFWKMDKGNILGKLLSMSQLERDDAEKYYHFYVAELKKLFKMDNIPVAMSKSLTSQQFVEETYMQQKHDETKKQDHEQKQFNVPNEFHIKQDEIVIICNPLVVLICIEQYNHHRIKNIPGASIDKQNMIDLFYY
eukprot:104736_1